MHPLRTKAAALASAFVGVLLVVACSSPFAPADPPDGGAAATEQEASSPDGAAGADVFVPTGDAATNDAANDASDAAPACVAPKKPDGAMCGASADCCSNACASNNTCKAACGANGAACDPFTSGACCVSLYCSPSAADKCVNCRPNGADAETLGVSGSPIPTSCCTGHVEANTKICAP
jgi:hypothetical protein